MLEVSLQGGRGWVMFSSSPQTVQRPFECSAHSWWAVVAASDFRLCLVASLVGLACKLVRRQHAVALVEMLLNPCQVEGEWTPVRVLAFRVLHSTAAADESTPTHSSGSHTHTHTHRPASRAAP